jgi:hypothetical protein
MKNLKILVASLFLACQIGATSRRPSDNKPESQSTEDLKKLEGLKISLEALKKEVASVKSELSTNKEEIKTLKAELKAAKDMLTAEAVETNRQLGKSKGDQHSAEDYTELYQPTPVDYNALPGMDFDHQQAMPVMDSTSCDEPKPQVIQRPGVRRLGRSIGMQAEVPTPKPKVLMNGIADSL